MKSTSQQVNGSTSFWGTFHVFRLLPLALCLLCASRAWSQSTATLVATDGLGRTLPTADECPLKTDDKPRTVGIFYITWHTPNVHDGHPYGADVTRVLTDNPQARLDGDIWPRWSAQGSYHWGEPEYGYFLSQDRYVIRHDISMLADAGVDVLIMDVTNAVRYWDEWEVLFSTMEEMKREGNRVPKFCFWAFNGPVISVVQDLYEHYYRNPRYQDLWFYWEGRPLLLCNATPSVDANPNGGQQDIADYSPEVRSTFTMRGMWWGYWEWAGERYVGTEDHWSFGFDLGDSRVAALTPEQLCSRHQGRLEEMAVTPAQHPVSIIGKSWRRDTGEPPLDSLDMPHQAYVPTLDSIVQQPTAHGIYFQDRWDEALQVDPDFIYLNDWNEWTAGKYRNGKDPSGQADLHIDFLGRQDNPFYFVDQYNAEFNRTIAPMRGGWTDNYYMQMVQNIRRYKGVPPMPIFHGLSKIRIDGQLDDWQLTDHFADTRGDVIHRDHPGYGNLHYTDTTGRNDILRTQVAMGRHDLYLAVETDSLLTPHTDPNWMLLLLDTDRNHDTGWEGYDYIVNLRVIDDHRTTLQRWDGHQWTPVATVPYAVSGRVLELSIPRRLLGITGSHVELDFKWADNPTSLSDIITLSTTGDTAPNRRFSYRYVWDR